MRYTYAYKSSDGVRHEAALDAPSREAAFAELRRRGIKPIKVVAADGSKANGEVRGVRKRMAVALAALAAAVAGIMAFFLGESSQPAADVRLAASSPRHQIYGDPVLIGKMERGEFAEWLPREGDRLLAWFAQPGKLMCPRNTSRIRLRRLDDRGVGALREVADRDVGIGEADSREVRELKQMVNGMREEMRGYLANGNGTVRSFWRRLLERTHQESQIYERTRSELEKVADAAVWEQKNESLRRLGLRTIPNPRDAE